MLLFFLIYTLVQRDKRRNLASISSVKRGSFFFHGTIRNYIYRLLFNCIFHYDISVFIFSFESVAISLQKRPQLGAACFYVIYSWPIYFPKSRCGSIFVYIFSYGYLKCRFLYSITNLIFRLQYSFYLDY